MLQTNKDSNWPLSFQKEVKDCKFVNGRRTKTDGNRSPEGLKRPKNS